MWFKVGRQTVEIGKGKSGISPLCLHRIHVTLSLTRKHLRHISLNMHAVWIIGIDRDCITDRNFVAFTSYTCSHFVTIFKTTDIPVYPIGTK